MYDVIIIGGGPAGVASVVYCARKKLKTLLITESFGGQSMVASKIENWIGEPNITGYDLAQKLEAHARSFPDVVKINDSDKVVEVASIECNDSQRECDFEVKTEKGESYSTKSIILVSGARRRKLGVVGEDKYEGKGVSYCSTCDAPIFKGLDVAVVGGGNAGLETIIDLFPYAKNIYLLERSGELRGDPVTQEKIRANKNVQIIMNAEMNEIVGESTVKGISYKDIPSGEVHELSVGGIFVAIGSVPNSEFVKDLVELDKHGQVITDGKHAKTSMAGIFAAGDVTDDPYKQNSISVGDGVRAALSAFAYLEKRKKVSPVDA